MMMQWTLGSLLLLLALVSADTSVHILSAKYGHNQLVTSSILNWIPDTHYSASKDFVIGGFELVDTDEASEGTRRPIFVCRALHNGVWVAGGQKEGENRCTVTLNGSVRAHERYQLLENVASAARVGWSDWNRYLQPPVGSVATDKLYVARHVAASDSDGQEGRRPSQTHYVGTLDSEETLGTISYVKETGEEASAEKGQLLVETEPISYELNEVNLMEAKRRLTKRHPRILAEETLSNNGDEPAKLAQALGYSYLHSIYWGQVKAMIKNLNTSVTLKNKTRLPDMNWGLEIRENRTGVYEVTVHLEPGTAVNVTLRADYLNVEVPYTGKLMSRYEDGATTSPRLISGIRHEETLADIRPEFGPVYFIGNLSLAPTTAAPPTTEPDQTTTTERPAATTTPPRRTEEEEEEEAVESGEEEVERQQQPQQYSKEAGGSADDENAILAKRPEATGMQGDAPEGSQNAASSARVLIDTLLLGLVAAVLARVT